MTLRVVLAGVLDLVKNEEATRLQLQQFHVVTGPPPRDQRLRVFVDLSRVTEIDPCALLYLIAHVDRISDIRGVRVAGNFPHPQHHRALKVLNDARFDEVVRVRRRAQLLRPARTSGPVVKISTGHTRERLNPMQWMPIYDFLRAHGELDADHTDALYNAIGECVENVRQHAYEHERGGHGRWYALGLRPSDAEPGRLVVLDLGVGIAGSVRQAREFTQLAVAFFGWIRDLVAELRGASPRDFVIALRNDDWPCVFWATQGLQTRTRDKERGTGLNGLRETVLETKQGALHVLSGTASVTWQHGVPPGTNRLPFLKGTAVCLEIGAADAHRTVEAQV